MVYMYGMPVNQEIILLTGIIAGSFLVLMYFLSKNTSYLSMQMEEQRLISRPKE